MFPTPTTSRARLAALSRARHNDDPVVIAARVDLERANAAAAIERAATRLSRADRIELATALLRDEEVQP